jgi:bifunctional DNA-binding transcriptional regulator/antitoxin component of YhaV-PrlF toxin-antitoxin module
MTTKTQSSPKAISKLGQRREVVIPREFCEELGLKKGDFVEVTRRKASITIKRKRFVDPQDTLTPEEEKMVAKGFRQLRRGEHVTLDQLKDELGL